MLECFLESEIISLIILNISRLVRAGVTFLSYLYFVLYPNVIVQAKGHTLNGELKCLCVSTIVRYVSGKQCLTQGA